MKLISTSPKQTEKIAGQILKQTEPGATLALNGDLGSGKTNFTKAIAKHLRIKNHVTSPTFVLLKIYEVKNNPNFKKLVHVDCYRISSSDELLSLGLREHFEDNKTLTIIEWADRIKDVLPKDTINLGFAHTKNPNSRIITSKFF